MNRPFLPFLRLARLVAGLGAALFRLAGLVALGLAGFALALLALLQRLVPVAFGAATELALKGLARRLARPHFPTRKFPLTGEDAARRPLADQHAPVLLDDPRYHPYHRDHRGHTTTAANGAL